MKKIKDALKKLQSLIGIKRRDFIASFSIIAAAVVIDQLT